MTPSKMYQKVLSEVKRRDKAAAKAGVVLKAGPYGKIGDGTLIKWLIANKDTVIQLLPVIISLFG